MTRHLLVRLLIAGMLALPFHIFAQRTCASHEVMLQQMNANPDFIKKLNSIEEHTAKYLKSPHLKATGTITIPVHVIVVYANSAQNISDAQIQSQINVLNLDYRKQNSDWTSTPSEFRNLVTDSEIEFTLQGIERHSNSRSSWGTNDVVKSTYPPYSPTTHLNIWVCNIGNGILGYAQFPGGSPSTDGVVIGSTYFGSSDYSSNFNLSAPFDKGRTATHEIGHWLNLRHIWGDGGCGATDYVSDTPDALEENYGCPSHPHYSCSSNDMFMNYMDYVDDQCMHMFSEGQKSRMRALFDTGGARESFVSGNSGGGTTPPTPGDQSTIIASDDFESGWGNWTSGGSDCALYNGGTRAYSGSRAIDIQDNSGVASSFYLKNNVDVNTPNYTNIEVKFYFYSYSMENGEDFWVQYYDGSTWNTVASYASGTSFNNSTFYVATVQIPETSYTFPSNMNIRFMCDASSNSDDVYIDDITITASTGTAKISKTNTIRAFNSALRGETIEPQEEVLVFPNPAKNKVTLKVQPEDYTSAQIFGYNGVLIRTINITSEETTIDISDLSKGIYIIKVNSDEDFVIHKLTKE